MQIFNWIIIIGIALLFILYMSIPIIYIIRSIVNRKNPKMLKHLNDTMDEIMRDWP
jgi:hypothetical protein